ncbi:MAG: ABC transporter permease subunit [Anaerolineae bacterium]|nr:ABC transporter permease subunit [Anaerolineae bacterium]
MDISPQSQLSGAMATTTPDTGLRFNRGATRILIGLVILAVLVNIVFLALIAQNDRPLIEERTEQSEDLSLASFIDANRVLEVTVANELILMENGTPAAQTSDFAMLIGGIAAAPGQDVIYVGTADGKITALDYELKPVEEIATVDGRVVGMKSLGDDGFLVAHGIGPFSDKYYVSYFPTGATEPAFTTQVEFTISSLDAVNGIAYYGTANARAGAISVADGIKLWSSTTKRPITRILGLPEGGAVVGDERGNVTRFDAEGNMVWEAAPTQYIIRSLAYDAPTDTFFVGNERGELISLDSQGKTLSSRTLADDDLEAFYDLDSGGKIVLPRNGQWANLNPSAIGSVGVVQSLRTLETVVNIGLLAAMVTALIMAVEQLRLAVRKLLGRMWRGRMAYMLLLPAMGCILIFAYYPTLLAAYYSLTNHSARNPVTEFIGLKNYIDILTKDTYFRIGFGNMVLITVTNMLKVITMPLLVAELIFWLRKESRRYLFRTLYLLPAVVPGLIGVYMWTMVYDPYDGLLNHILNALFGIPMGRAWLADETTAIWAIIFHGFPYVAAFPLLIYMGGLININAELFDAARIDGASWWKRFTRIDIPLLTPQIRLLLFFAFNGAVSGFADVYVFTRGGPGNATYVPGLQMYLKISEGDFGYASAIGGILFVLVFIGTLFIVRSRRSALADM